MYNQFTSCIQGMYTGDNWFDRWLKRYSGHKYSNIISLDHAEAATGGVLWK